MLLGETGPAGVRRIVHEDCSSLWSDLSLEVGQVDLPASLRKERVGVVLHTQVLADGLAEWEAGLGDQNAIANFAEDCNRIVEGS